MKKTAIAASLAAAFSAPFLGAFAGPALAQEAVPLTYDLLDLVWVVTEYEGRIGESAAPQIGFGETTAQGVLPCGDRWSAHATKDQLPRLQITDVTVAELAVPECQNAATDAAFVKALQAIVRIDTTPEGLGFFAADGRQVMLAVSGG